MFQSEYTVTHKCPSVKEISATITDDDLKPLGEVPEDCEIYRDENGKWHLCVAEYHVVILICPFCGAEAWELNKEVDKS